MNELIELLCNASISDSSDENSNLKEKVIEHNRIILNYNLNYKRLAFLGYAVTGKSKKKTMTPNTKYKKKFKLFPRKIDFESYIEHCITNNKCVEVLEYIPNKKVTYIEKYLLENPIVVNTDVGPYDLFPINDEYIKRTPAEKERLKSVVLKLISNYDSTYHDITETYRIDMNTIINTRDLIESGVEIIFKDKWMNLDKLEELIKKGNELFCIRVSHSGDGITPGSMYSLGCWPHLHIDKPVTIIDSFLN